MQSFRLKEWPSFLPRRMHTSTRTSTLTHTVPCSWLNTQTFRRPLTRLSCRPPVSRPESGPPCFYWSRRWCVAVRVGMFENIRARVCCGNLCALSKEKAKERARVCWPYRHGRVLSRSDSLCAQGVWVLKSKCILIGRIKGKQLIHCCNLFLQNVPFYFLAATLMWISSV